MAKESEKLKALPTRGNAGSRLFGTNGEARFSMKGVPSAAPGPGGEDCEIPSYAGACKGELETQSF